MNNIEKINAINYTYNVIYKKYGHILGHYFRNMYYVMKTIDGFTEENKEYYARLYRAQFSRYELALCVFNSLTFIRSHRDMVELLLGFKMLNGFYYKDLYFTFGGNGLQTEKEMQKYGEQYVNSLLEEFMKMPETDTKSQT